VRLAADLPSPVIDDGSLSRRAGWLGELELLGYPVAAGDILVGADYGASGYQALRYAALIAEARYRPLRIVRVLRDVDWLLDPRPVEELLAVGERRGHAVLDDMIALARSVAPALHVRTQLLRGSVYSVLLDESATAGLLVLGSERDHRRTEERHRPVTTIGQWLQDNACCPVLVVDAGGHVVAEPRSLPIPPGRGTTPATSPNGSADK